jgi:hypothetical protein
MLTSRCNSFQGIQKERSQRCYDKAITLYEKMGFKDVSKFMKVSI